MRIISFAWTTPAVMALRKTCTRRDWADSYALSWHAGDFAAAYDRLPRVGGKQFGIVRLTKRPYKELTSQMSADDYENEGFKWMEEQHLLIQEKSPLDFCQEWINAGKELWVVRFKIITVTSTTLNYPLWPSLWPDVLTRSTKKHRLLEVKMYVYIQSEKPGWFPSPRQENSVYLTGSLWTVGFYSPDGMFNPESDHETPEKAAERVAWLNGNPEPENPYILHGAELDRAIKSLK